MTLNLVRYRDPFGVTRKNDAQRASMWGSERWCGCGTFVEGNPSYIFKGCSAEMLTCALRAVNAGASWMDPLIARRLIELNLSMHSGTKLGAAPLQMKTSETEIADAPELLSPREQQVLTFLVLGWRNKQIAAELGISGDTIKTHVRHILEKLNVTTRTEAAVQATRLGLCGASAITMRAVV